MPASQDKKVLVTGGTGFIGRHAIGPLLAEGFDVHLVTRPGQTFPGAPGGVQSHSADLLRDEDVRGVLDVVAPSHLLHFAWYAEHGMFWASDLNLDWVRASLALLKGFAARGGRRAVLAGTCAEYDWSFGYCSEQATPTRPRTLYGVCKNSLREIAARYAQNIGLELAWGRIFFVYGPDEHPGRLLPSLTNCLTSDRPARCKYGAHLRDFLHAEDVGRAFAQLLASPVCGPVNIASGIPVSLAAVAEKLAQKLHKNRWLQIESLPATDDNPATLLADTKRLQTEVGWRPKYSLDEGLDHVLAPHFARLANSRSSQATNDLELVAPSLAAP